jgi:hypothetical protein
VGIGETEPDEAGDGGEREQAGVGSGADPVHQPIAHARPGHQQVQPEEDEGGEQEIGHRRFPFTP